MFPPLIAFNDELIPRPDIILFRSLVPRAHFTLRFIEMERNLQKEEDVGCEQEHLVCLKLVEGGLQLQWPSQGYLIVFEDLLQQRW